MGWPERKYGLLYIGIAVVKNLNAKRDQHLIALLDDVADVVCTGKVTAVLGQSGQRCEEKSKRYD